MRKFSVLFLIAILAFTVMSCQNMKKEKSKTVILHGKIGNPLDEMVIFTVSGLTDPFLTDTAWLNEQGEFETSFTLDKCRPVTFKGGNEFTQMYLCPGDAINMSLSTEAFDESIKYEGVGAEKNNFLAEYYLKFEDSENTEIPKFYELRDTAASIFMSMADQQNKDAMAFLNQAIEQYDLPQEFISFMNTKLYFDKISNIQMITLRNNKDTSDAARALDKELRDIVINAAGFEEPDYLAEEYQGWLNYNLKLHVYSEIHESVPDYDKEIYDSLLYKRFEQILPPFAMQLYIYNNGVNLAEAYNLEAFDMLMPKIGKYVTDTAWKNSLQAKYDEMVFALSQPMPDDAVLYNLDDEELLSLTFDDILAQFKGNVIYLDFWASWCGPCKAEMPNSKALAEKLKDEDVTFLYVSVDRNAKAWEDMIRIMQLHGIHYRLGKNTSKPVSEKYDVQYIPHYVLFDKKGNMVKNNMTRPGDPETEKMIRELL